jgi:hypothetical protein
MARRARTCPCCCADSSSHVSTLGPISQSGLDVDGHGAVPDHEIAVDDVEVPLVEAFVPPLLALPVRMPEQHDAARADDGDHVLDDPERVGAVVERVAGVRDIEASGAEMIEQPFAGDPVCPHGRLQSGRTKHPVVLVRKRIDRDEADPLPGVTEAGVRHGAGADVEDRQALLWQALYLGAEDGIPQLGGGGEAKLAVARPLLGPGRAHQPRLPEGKLAAPPASPGPEAAADR